MEKSKYRIEVYHKYTDPRCAVVVKKLLSSGYSVTDIHITDNYLINADVPHHDAERIAGLLINPVTQKFLVNRPYVPAGFDFAIEIGFLPGVTDNVAHTVREAAEDLLKISLDHEKSVFTTVTFFISGKITRNDAESIGADMYNPLIQRIKILSRDEYGRHGMWNEIPVVELHERPDADEIEINVPDAELEKIGKEGIAESDGSRRGPLALDMLSMNVIKKYFLESEKRNPTDVELESIAQTWSEHCKHTIFAAEIDEIKDGIFKRYIREATVRIRREKGERDFCVSVFTDNAGGIEFDDNYVIADKVETHNSPSALDPFGGSITGIVGVNRDAMGFGLGAKPVANRYGFCFADPFDRKPLYRSKNPDSMMLSPRRIMDGVISGVNAGGNTSGIPTPQGFIYFDERYKGKPLVFVGTIGLIPKKINGASSVVKKAMDGDLIVMTGGRVGRDGIHGATFSSEALTSGSPAAAVQIGDPITQKKMSDAIVKEARDLGLYNSITDNGAGGLSCSVAEMAKECGGFEVELENVPLKYPGLSPWQIWVSESQERMTLAVPSDKIDRFNELMKIRGVESTVIGRFTSGNRGMVYYHGRKVFDLDMTFLHDGLPKKVLTAKKPSINVDYPEFSEPEDINAVFIEMLSRLNISGYDFISRQYDHEVQASSVIKPLQGKGMVNANSSVIRPLLDSWKGVVLSQGLYPSYSEADPYRMAACSIDTAIRNAIAAGGTLDRMAILDNFCWCDSNNPERLWQLKESARACYDTAVDYGTPFVSGKDSMFNDFRGFDENFNPVNISVPPTLLVSSIGVVDDVRLCQTIDFKFEGDIIYVIGTTLAETGGSEYNGYIGEKKSGKKYTGNDIPKVDTKSFRKIYDAYESAVKKGLIASGISVERGGLGVALAKAGIAGMLGFEVGLGKAVSSGISRNDIILYSESQGRFVVTVNPGRRNEFESVFVGLPFAAIGNVRGDSKVIIKGLNGETVVSADVSILEKSYRSKFSGF